MSPEAPSNPDPSELDRLGAAIETAASSIADLRETYRRAAANLNRPDSFDTVESSTPITVWRGPDAPLETWRHAALSEAPEFARAVLPDVSRMVPGDPELLKRFYRLIGGEDRVARMILSAEAIKDDAVRLRGFADISRGIEIRVMTNPPSWFWVNDNGMLALPETWGDSWPEVAITFQSTPIASALSALFDVLWQHATPITRERSDWEQVVEVLSQGMDTHQAAAVLGVSTRTVRRRLDRAMAELKADSLVALGAAWAARR